MARWGSGTLERRLASGVERRSTHWSLRAIVRETWRGFRADRGLDLAGSLAFTTILTAVPLLATFSLFLVTFFKENDEQILAIVNEVLPYQTARLTQNLRDFISESTAISGVGLVLLIVASVRLVFVVEGVFNAVWGAPRRRALVRRIILFTFSLLALGLVLGGISWGVRAMRRYVETDSILNNPVFAASMPFLLKAIVLTLLFRYLPNARVKLAAAATAGTAVALGLEVLRLGYTVYVDAMLRMNLITGSLAFALIVILSLYFAWALILIGVELTHVLQMLAPDAQADRGREGRAEKAVRMLLRMSSADPAPLKDLEPNPDTAPAEALDILEDLKAGGIVDGNEAAGFRLARSGREITISAVLDALAPGFYQVNPYRQDRVALVLEPIFYRLESERRRLLSCTLAELRPR
jgi:membrane protein